MTTGFTVCFSDPDGMYGYGEFMNSRGILNDTLTAHCFNVSVLEPTQLIRLIDLYEEWAVPGGGPLV
jgi:hypothetical protein